jgi:diadenosine tetraphosphate (Ap4A) HIT family hydrolase
MDCPFCNPDREIIAENDHSIAIFDSHPVSPGHALVIPRHHVSTIFDLADDEYASCFNLVRKIREILEEKHSTDAFNVGVNCGETAGQTVDHAHIHVIPRYSGDVDDPRGGVRHIIPDKGFYDIGLAIVENGISKYNPSQSETQSSTTGTYMDVVSRILRRGSFSNSYKFALLRSLATFGEKEGSGYERISTDWLAERFVEFYWPLTLLFRLRQENNPSKPPIVMREIKKEALALGLSPETKISVYKREHPDQYERLIKRVSTQAFDDVIKCLHNIRGNAPVEPRLYDFDENSIRDGIEVNSEVRTFLQENHQTIDLLAIGGWVKFTEKYTSAPKLYEKLQGIEPNRKALNAYRNFFLNQGDEHCFYCSNQLEAKPEVDHVIPWSFVADDKVWNLVLACKKCNGSGGKSNRLPHVEFVMALIQRNDKIMANNPDKLPLKIKTDLAEWRGQRTELGKHIEILVGRCEADGFDRWGPSL